MIDARQAQKCVNWMSEQVNSWENIDSQCSLMRFKS